MKDHKTEYLGDSEHYEQLSQLIKKSYEASSDISLYVQIDEISQWIQSANSKPLLITSPEYGGKKTLICELIKHIEKKENCLVICEFASVTSYYSEILYKITMQLRTQLSINQKVELNEEKLRQYFRYWLEVADDKIEKDFLGYSKGQKKQVVILIEGIDKVVDNKNQRVGPSFWFPDLSLKNIKIILTSKVDSNAVEFPMPDLSQKIEYVISDSKISTIKQNLYKSNPKLRSFSDSVHFGDLKIAKKILDSHAQLEISGKDIGFVQFFEQFVKYLSSSVDSEENIYKLLGCLIWSKKGLTKNTLRRSYRLPGITIQKFLVAFGDIILCCNDTYLIISRRMREYISKIITKRLSSQGHNVKKDTHIMISKVLKKQNNTVNTLQEMIYHLAHSQNYTQLKQLMSRVENFLVLYTPLTKHILCVCWFQLEIQFQYDPVFEYNKAIERFLNHYYPSPEDTFKIIFQLSLFFKEYSQFENSKTPQFRHPPIRGEVEHLKEISIYDQLVDMSMYQKCKVKTKEVLEENLGGKTTRREKQLKSTKQIKEIPLLNLDLEGAQLLESAEGKQVEKLNVRIKFHQDKFKSLYLQEMEPYANAFFVLKKKIITSQKDQLLDEDSDDSEGEMDESKVDLQKIKKGLLLKKFSDYCEEEYHRCSQKRSFYYYKQWIWMQFPWISQSLNSNYSELIEKCMKSPTEYMSIDLESKLISEAVKIAKIAKETKKQIYEHQKPDQSNRESKSFIHDDRQSGSVSRSVIKLKTVKEQLKEKFDISKLDSELDRTKVKKHRNNITNDSLIFMTDISVTQSRVEDKQNEPPQTQRLPNILKCSTLAASKASRNCDLTQTREYSMLVSKVDELKFENEQLVFKIQCIQQNRSCLKKNNKEYEKQALKLAIEQLKQRKTKIMRNYKTQEALKGKLEMIIKLCDINKSHGSESADLNSFLSSLKTMFKIEEKNLLEINQNCKKFLEESRAEYRRVKEGKQNVFIKLKKEKSRFERTMSMSVLCMENKEVHKLKQKSKKHNKTVSKDAMKKLKLEKDLEHVNKEFEELHEQFGIVSGDHDHNQEILCGFQQKVDKLNEIQWKLNELMDENVAKEKKIMELEERINVNKGHRQHQKQLAQRGMQSVINEGISKAEERVRCLERCFSLIEQKKSSVLQV